VLKLNPDFWVPQEVKEFIWSTQRGYESMLSLFSGLSINKSQIEWYEPGNSPFLAKFFDNGQKFSVARQIMFRVLDVPSALEGLKPVGSGEFTIEVFDPALPENGGPWRVTFGEGEVSVEPSSSGDLRMDIRTFTQALLGEPSLADCIAAGAVEGGSSAGTSAALQLLSPQRVYCADFF
jgi:predicted acetyltransferase